MNVETCMSRVLDNPLYIASIEPHSYECGNFICQYEIPGADGASIEPHSYECGNLEPGVQKQILGTALQLSHIHMNVETSL